MSLTDFHTHHLQSGVTALLSGGEPGRYSSLELHPWRLQVGEPTASQLERIPLYGAIGEIGLDKLRGAPWPEQLRSFETMLGAAQEYRKPVVIHCVRAWAELFEFRKRFPQLRMMIHGFRASPELLEELRRKEFWVSLGKAGAEKLPSDRFRWEKIGLESDDDPQGVAPVYELAEARSVCPELEEKMAENLEEFLG